MNPFQYERASSVGDAARKLGTPGAKGSAGGTNLVDLMKERVATPSTLVDIGRLALRAIEPTADGGLRLGALATNADTAREVKDRYPLLAEAILAGASPQLRNMATNGGNLLQRTRCYYFYDVATPCNKRTPGSGCPAIGGQNRIHAILGASDACIAVHPSDMCVALAALDAVVHVEGAGGRRSLPFAELHRLPGTTPELDTNLAADDVIVAIELPPPAFTGSHYLKLRDRASYAFALVSVAAGLTLQDGKIAAGAVALGGVAHRPWRDRAAEALLAGAPATHETFARFAEAVLKDARGQGENDFKIELGKRAIVRALTVAAGGVA